MSSASVSHFAHRMVRSEYSQKANDPQRHCHTSGSAASRGLNPTTLIGVPQLWLRRRRKLIEAQKPDALSRTLPLRDTQIRRRQKLARPAKSTLRVGSSLRADFRRAGTHPALLFLPMLRASPSDPLHELPEALPSVGVKLNLVNLMRLRLRFHGLSLA
jgi:hypothetical protein